MIDRERTTPFKPFGNFYSIKGIDNGLLPILAWLLMFVVMVICMCILFIGYPDIFVKKIKVPIEVPIEVEKQVDVIKYVEMTGMPTAQFVMHFNPRVDPAIAEQIGNAVDKYSKEYQIPKKLILGIIKKESTFNPFAKSSVAFGLMQVYPKYHQEKIDKLGIKDQRELYHIDNAINLGCQIFREYYTASNEDLDETFHKYLSKKATKEQVNAYKNAILTAWARMEMMEYEYKNKKDNEDGV